MADYLPGPDESYESWINNFVNYASANLAALGLVAGDMVPVTSAQTTFGNNLAGHVAAKAAAMAAKQDKDDARQALTALVRPLVRRLQAYPGITNGERASLGITIPAADTPVEAPTTRPVATITTWQRLQHTLSFVEESTPTRRAKPRGAIGVEVWSKIGTTPPAGVHEMEFRGFDSSTPTVVNFTSADGCKTAYYWTRWVTAQGEYGPWSEQVEATIAA
jgi:hypothetical protein